MAAAKTSRTAQSLRLLEELPGVADVVWTVVARLGGSPQAATVLFTAPERGAGTTVLAAATALGLVLHERVPVCLVETSVGAPALARYLGLDGPGLAEVLSGDADLDDCLVELPDCNGLFVLTAGEARAPRPGAFTTAAFANTLARLRARCHYLVLDAAPVISHVEARRLADHADGAVLVVRARSTRRLDAERSVDVLTESGTLLLGTVFNADLDSRSGAPLGEVRRAFGRALRHTPVRSAVEIAPPHAPRSRAVQAAPVASTASTAPPAPIADQAANHAASAPAATNGAVAHAPPPPHDDDDMLPLEGRAEIERLERRVAKLLRRLEETEQRLADLSAAQSIDQGLASLDQRSHVPSALAEARASKALLMQAIFQANVELKEALAVEA